MLIFLQANESKCEVFKFTPMSQSCVETILDKQQYSIEMKRWLVTLIGRLLRTCNDSEQWSCEPVIYSGRVGDSARKAALIRVYCMNKNSENENKE